MRGVSGWGACNGIAGQRGVFRLWGRSGGLWSPGSSPKPGSSPVRCGRRCPWVPRMFRVSRVSWVSWVSCAAGRRAGLRAAPGCRCGPGREQRGVKECGVLLLYGSSLIEGGPSRRRSPSGHGPTAYRAWRRALQSPGRCIGVVTCDLPEPGRSSPLNRQGRPLRGRRPFPRRSPRTNMVHAHPAHHDAKSQLTDTSNPPDRSSANQRWIAEANLSCLKHVRLGGRRSLVSSDVTRLLKRTAAPDPHRVLFPLMVGG